MERILEGATGHILGDLRPSCKSYHVGKAVVGRPRDKSVSG